ncbi:MAG: hypothetical protein ABI442_17640 [Gemmatimonadaceae bacterium]
MRTGSDIRDTRKVGRCLGAMKQVGQTEPSYATTPDLDRLSADEWFLMTAYRRLGALDAASGDRVKADEYRKKLATLQKDADPE